LKLFIQKYLSFLQNKKKLIQFNKTQKRALENYKFSSVKKVLVYCRFSSNEEIQSLQAKIKSIFKDIKCDILLLKPSVQKDETIAAKYFTYNDCDFFMNPKAEILRQIVSENYDVFISLISDEECNIVDENILVMNQAKIRAGLYLPNKPYCLDVFCDTKSKDKTTQLQNIVELLKKIN